MRLIGRLIFCCILLTTAPARAAEIDFGAYHALIIGINNYAHLRPLETAVDDARAVRKILEGRYGFKTTLLLNPTRATLMRALDGLRESMSERDNLLIYYAGHGYLDKLTGEGFWLPANAEENSQVEWIPTSTVTRFLRANLAKHALVIADSCYSGTLTRDGGAKLQTGVNHKAELLRLSSKRSRKALTSGGLEPVNDGGGDGHSVFTRALLDALRSNAQVLDGYGLYRTVRRNVILNAKQTPLYADVRFAGDEGGDFLFVPVAAQASLARQEEANDAATFFTGAEIKATLVGNTLRFKSLRAQKIMRLHFRAGGQLELAAEDDPTRLVQKKWWIANKRALCRTFGKENNVTCQKLAANASGTGLRFFKPDGAHMFDATVLPGRQFK